MKKVNAAIFYSIVCLLPVVGLALHDFYIVTFEFLAAYLIDCILTYIVVMLILTRKKDEITEYFRKTELKPLTIFIIAIASCVVIFAFQQRVPGYLNNITRELLLKEYEISRALNLSLGLVLVAFIYSILSSVLKTRFKLVVLVVFTISLLVTMSRSEILKVLFVYVTYLIYIHQVSNKVLFKVMIYCIIAGITFGGLLTIFQGRSENIQEAAWYIIDTFLRYRTFPLLLSEYSVELVRKNPEHILFPFFGFIIERFLSIISEIPGAVSVQGSTFVSEFRSLGRGGIYTGNVLYPWWSWFFGLAGYAGLFLKAIYIYVVLEFVRRMKLYMTFVFLVTHFLFWSPTIHPFLNNDAMYSLLAFVIFDIINKRRLSFKVAS